MASEVFSESFLELFRREDLRPLLPSDLFSFSMSLFELPRLRSLSRSRGGIPGNGRIRASVAFLAGQHGWTMWKELDAYQLRQALEVQSECLRQTLKSLHGNDSRGGWIREVSGSDTRLSQWLGGRGVAGVCGLLGKLFLIIN